MRIYTMIDEPGPFDTIEAWESYAATLEALPEDALERVVLLPKAKEWIDQVRTEQQRACPG